MLPERKNKQDFLISQGEEVETKHTDLIHREKQFTQANNLCVYSFLSKSFHDSVTLYKCCEGANMKSNGGSFKL